jgi:hypothetical protein
MLNGKILKGKIIPEKESGKQQDDNLYNPDDY